ncbi:MAG: cupin domain-containing protein [Methanobacterium sp.]|nr:cupin domain-containing protein [Methanobacterium sp.]
MLIKTPQNCEYFRVLDKTLICELLHPQREIKDLEMNFSIAHAILKPGESSLSHKMKASVEIYYILEGKGLMHIENEKKEVKPNQIVYIPPNSAQWIKNLGDTDLKFLCLVNPPWKAEDEELIS